MSLRGLIRDEMAASRPRSEPLAAMTTVEDLAELLLEGVRALVDPLSPRAFVLDTDAHQATGGQGEHDGGT
ncbi:hypothetical protein H3T12_45645 [Streptomyces sp. GMR22]|nr:hypothetical protein [Streptomyces sp. GMR22]